MRLVFPFAVGLLLLVGAVPPLLAADDHGAVVPREDSERDLAIEAEVVSGEKIEPGQDVRITARLVNRSKTVTYRVVRPGDGSESDLREPWVHWTATVTSKDGVVEDVPERMLGRCGLYDANWHDEVMELAPGASIPLSDTLPLPSLVLDMQTAGTTRIRLHYAYRARAVPERETLGDAPPEGVGRMEGVEPFEIVSEPLPIEVVRPLDVVASVRAPLCSDVRRRASKLFKAEVRNTTEHALILHPREWTISIELGLEGGRLSVREPVGTRDTARRAERVTLAPGETRPLFGEGGLVPDYDRELQAADRKALRVAVVLYAGVENTRRIASHWMDLPVAK